MADNSRIGKRFSAIAPVYDSIVKLVFGERLWNLQDAILQDLPLGDNCLIIGGGTGKILEFAVERNLASNYFYAELSDKMIAQAQARLASLKHKIIYSNDWKDWQNKSFDYIILPFVLDCYSAENARLLVIELSKCMSKNGKLVLVDFFKTNNHLQSLFIKSLYLFFRFFIKIESKKLPPYHEIFSQIGFEMERKKTAYHDWIQGIVWTKIKASA